MPGNDIRLDYTIIFEEKLDLSISATEYVNNIKNGHMTVEEFVAKTMDQIENMDKNIHAFLSVNENALNEAKLVDAKLKRKEKTGKLLGMPISVKDNICIKDSKTTCASRMLEDFVAPYDGTVISRLKNEDAILIGKTNLDEFAMGISTEFSAYGPTRNPWNQDCVPGGSSGGSAASVSALESVASIGTDTGGSIRNPASYCSVVGLKPTYGLVSRYGLISYANSIEVVGPIARKVEDIALILNVITGLDPNDDTTLNDNTLDYLENIDDGVKGKKIGIIKESLGEGTNEEVRKATLSAADKMQSMGAECEEFSLKDMAYGVAAYYTITSAEAGSNLARFDNIRYGYDFEAEGYEFNSYLSKARSKMGSEVTRRMILGGFIPSAGYGGKYLLKALKVRSKISKEIQEAFKKYDILLSPTVPVPPFKIGEKIDDPIALFLIDYNTVAANLSGVPAISIPYGFSGGLPIGVQLSTNFMEEKKLLQAAYALQTDVQQVQQGAA